MKKIKQFIFGYFTRAERLLWLCSVTFIILSFVIFDRSEYMKLLSSLIGVTSLIFCAKGNPAGPLMMAVFSLFYGIVALSFAYYGEVLTYMGMSFPMALVSLVSWLRNPYRGKRSQVEVGRLKKWEPWLMAVLTVLVTALFYFILAFLNTANLPISTFSVATSFIAVYFSARRSPYFALAYAVNDVVLIVMWILASIEDPSYLSVVFCFAAFLANDLYSFINWKRMQQKQHQAS